MSQSKLVAALAILVIGSVASPTQNTNAQGVQRASGRLDGRSQATSEIQSIVGRWEWKLDVGPKSGKVIMNVSKDGKRYSATLTTPEGEKIRPKEFVVKGNKIKVRIERQRGLFTFKMTHEGELSGDTIRGEFNARGGPIKKTGKWLATRVKNPVDGESE